MAGALVIRTGLTIVGSLPSGTGDPQLTVDAASKQVGQIPSVDASTYLSTALPSTQIFVGSVASLAAAVAVTGAISITNAGVVTLNTGIVFNSNINDLAGITYSKLNLTGGIVNADINATAAITRTKIANGTAYRVLVNNVTGVFSENTAITGSRALISDVNGLPTHSAVTSATLAFLDVTSSAQTQLNNRLAFSSGITPSTGDLVFFSGGVWTRFPKGSSGQYLTSTAGTISWVTVPNGMPTGGSAGQYLNKIDGTDFNTQWSTLTLASLTDVTATAAQVNVLATGFYDATSSVQTQLSLKLDKTLTQNYLFVGNISNVASPFATGPNGYILTSVGGVPTWVAPTGGGTVTSVAASGGTTGMSFTGSPITISGTLVLTGILNVANGGTGSATFPGWLLASGGALTGNNTISGGFAVDFNTISRLSITQSAQAVSWSKAFNVIPGAHTLLTANTEFLGLNTNVTAVAQQWSTGALTIQRWNYVGPPTIGFVGASTLADAYNMYIANPIAGTNATITRTWSLGLEGGLDTGTQSGRVQLKDVTANVVAINFPGNGVGFGLGSGGSIFTLLGNSNTGFMIYDSSIGYATPLARLHIKQGALSSSWIPAGRFEAGAHTGMTAATEFPDHIFGGLTSDTNTAVSTRTATWLAGTVTTQRSMYVRGTVLTGASATATFTNAYTLYIDPPSAGTNAAITNNYTLGVSGTSYIFNTTASGTTEILDANNTIGGVWLRFTTGQRAAEYGRWQVGGNSVDYIGGQFKLGFSGVSTTFTQSNNPTAWIPAMTFQIGTHTSMTASTELPMIVNNTVTMQWATGALALQRNVYFKAPTYAFVGASTLSDAYNVYIDIPVAGTNATITRNWALGLSGPLSSSVGSSQFGTATGTARLGINTAPTGGALNVLGTAGLNTISIQASSTAGTFSVDDSGGTLMGSTTFANTSKVTIRGALVVTTNPQSSAWMSALVVTPAAHTALTASTEFITNDFGTITQTWLAGTVATQRFTYFRGITVAGATATNTITNAYTVYIDSPVVGTNAAITNNWALGVAGNITSTGTTIDFNAATIVNMTGANCQLIFSGTSSQIRVQSIRAANQASELTFDGGTNGAGISATTGAHFDIFQSTSAVVAGWDPALRVTSGAHTAQTAATEFPDFIFGGLSSDAITAASTRTQTWLAGTVATQRSVYIKGTILTGTSATANFTNAYTVFIDSPSQGTNASVSNAWALGLAGSALITQTSGLSALRVVNTSNGGQNAAMLTQSIFSSTLEYGGQGFVLTGQAGSAIGNVPILKLIGGVMSAQNASTELTDVNFDLSRTVTWATGAIATQRSVWVKGMTIAFAGASVVTNAYSVYIDPPVQGANATLTGNYALGLNGKMRFITVPTNDNAATDILMRDSTTGEVKYRTVASLPGGGSGWSASTSTTITGNTSQTGNFTNTFLMDGVLITQNVKSSGTPTAFTVSPGAHTGLTLSTEVNDVLFNLNRTVQWATGAITLQRGILINSSSYSLGFVGASLVTDAATIGINGNPAAGTNATISNSHSLYVTTGTGGVTNYGITVVGSASSYGLFLSGGRGVKLFQSVVTGGSPILFDISGGAHTGLTAQETPDFQVLLQRTVQFTGSTGFATQRAFYITSPTYAFASATGTITDASLFNLNGPPGAGVNAIITNSYGLKVESYALPGTVTNGSGIGVSAPTNATNNWAIQILSGNSKNFGKWVNDATDITAGTTGAQTINKPSGSVNFAAAATTLVVTNSFATTTSHIFLSIETVDTTAKSATVTRASGSFTITLNAAATAETRVAFIVTN